MEDLFVMPRSRMKPAVVIVPQLGWPVSPVFLPNNSKGNGEYNFCLAMCLLSMPNGGHISQDECLNRATDALLHFPVLASLNFIYAEEANRQELERSIIERHPGSTIFQSSGRAGMEIRRLPPRSQGVCAGENSPLVLLAFHGATPDQIETVSQMSPDFSLNLKGILSWKCRHDTLAFLVENRQVHNVMEPISLVLRNFFSSPAANIPPITSSEEALRIVDGLIKIAPDHCSWNVLGSAIKARCPNDLITFIFENMLNIQNRNASKLDKTLRLCFPSQFPDGYLMGDCSPLKSLEDMIASDDEIEKITVAFQHNNVPVDVWSHSCSRIIGSIVNGLGRKKTPVQLLLLEGANLNQDVFASIVSCENGPAQLYLSLCVLRMSSALAAQGNRSRLQGLVVEKTGVSHGDIQYLFGNLAALAPSLKGLRLLEPFLPIHEQGTLDVTEQVVDFLRRARKLEVVKLSSMHPVNLKRVCNELQCNATLTTLKADAISDDRKDGPYQCMADLLATTNTTLQSYTRGTDSNALRSPLWEKIRYYTDLNAHGRRHLRDPKASKEILVKLLLAVPRDIGDPAMVSFYYGLLQEGLPLLGTSKTTSVESPAKKRRFS